MEPGSDIETHIAESKAANEFPSPTGVALAVLDLCQREDTSTKEICKVIGADPALSGRLLKFANSPHVGFSRPVVAIEDAVILLGIRIVRHLTLSLSVLSNARSGKCENFDYQGFWGRSLATAIAAQILCSIDHLKFSPEEAFVCGLLARVGCLALASIYPDVYSEIITAAAQDCSVDLKTLERQNLCTDHTELSVALLQDWGLPQVYLSAVHDFENSNLSGLNRDTREYTLAKVLQLANHIGKMCIFEKGPQAALVPQLIVLAEEIGIGRDEIKNFFDCIVEQWIEWGRILDIPTQPVAPFTELLTRVRQLEQRPVRPDKNSLRILIVDDDPATQQLLSRILAESGHHVLTASNGREGLRLALEADPQLVVTDWVMPNMDGIELCRALRKARLGQLLYIIVLTAREDEDCLVTAFDAGADDYVVKPFSRKVLEARIRGGERLIHLQDEIAKEQDENRRYLAELAIMNRRLQESAMTDLLTELPNRRYATEYLGKEWAASERSGQELTCLMVDVDHFKRFNDRYGHETGDEVLTEVAGILRDAARTSDLVCRFGGEEFLVICSATNATAAQHLAERLRIAVESKKFTAGNLRVTISVGVAIRNATMKTDKELVRKADRALLLAKRSGRNRVCLTS
jgi:two-component system cell cycle response regulator